MYLDYAHSYFLRCPKVKNKVQPAATHQPHPMLTSKRLVQLNPILEDKVAVILPMPKPGLSVELSNACLHTSDRTRICEHGKMGPETESWEGPKRDLLILYKCST